MTPRETRSTCCYCGVGCGVIVTSEGDAITGVRGDPDHPANRGRLCTKGATLHRTAGAQVTRQTRLLAPMHRAERGAPPQPVTWDRALDLAAMRLGEVIERHGPDAVGFYVSGQLLTEDYYVFNKLAKGLIGTNNIDTNSRLCMSSAVAGYKKTLGADAPPACYDDLDHAHCVFIAGANPAYAHPVLFRRLEDARRANPSMKIVVADPRRTDSVALADLHLPLLPGTDVMLFHGMLHVMLWEGWTRPEWIAAHTTGFDALKARVRACTPERVAQVCGIAPDALLTAARWFATSPATLSLYCQGLNQSSSGTAKNAALINLHLAAAQIGRPGAGPFSLTGQPNAMGGREVGGLANLLSAHRDLADPAHRAEVAAFWGVSDVPAAPGLTAVELFQAAADGQVRALWIACTNPAQSMPDQATVRRALQRAEFVVLQEAFATPATASFADLLLPATTWGEKDGTVTNSERRISRVRAAVPAPGEARHDWRIVVDLAHRLEVRLGRPGLFPYATPEAIWNEHRESTRGRDLDITGLSYALLEQRGPQQWPMPEGAAQGAARLYGDGVFPTPDGRARFVDAEYRPPHEARSAHRPFALITGRLRDQWHGMTRTGTLGRLFGHESAPVLQLNPRDLAVRGFADGDLVRVSSARGSLVVPVRGADEVACGQAFMAMHWGSEYLGGCDAQGTPSAGVNTLTTSARCPDSKQPELKHAAVRIERCALPWRVCGVAWLPDDDVLAVQRALRAPMADVDYAACVPFSSGAGGDERSGVLFHAAAGLPQEAGWLERIERLLRLDAADCLRYADPRLGQRRTVRLRRDGAQVRLEGFLIAGDTRAQRWMTELLRASLPVQADGRRLLQATETPPVAVPERGRAVCTCLNVARSEIAAHLGKHAGTPAERLASLQTTLGCGTQCGSCLPELKRLVHDIAPADVEPAPQPAAPVATSATAPMQTWS
ncbi:MAG TPA: molybdopterin-dependent oxidoreductase [Quisquiliibacterium sp.]|nr:molybdopterin-dependent oxidoreductase [Quisquiliibacterium sp.]